jgi:tRNA modification GTPase
VFRAADGSPLDKGLVLYFEAPASYTGEDVLELQGHGGPRVLDGVLACVLSHGVRPARPGEFTERAFLNGRLDLAQAEAVADLIDSRTQAAARAAVRSLMGDFSTEISTLSAEIGDLRVFFEADIDFSEEPVSRLDSNAAQARLNHSNQRLSSLLDQARPGSLLAHGARAVLAGLPNAGKSSLMNALAREDRAIVSITPGTTRDVVDTMIDVAGIAVQLTDTAGLREGTDHVEEEGVRRATQAIEQADLVLFVIDDAAPQTSQNHVSMVPDADRMLRIYNKCDLSGRAAGVVEDEGAGSIAVSAKTGVGIDALEQAIQQKLGYTGMGDAPVMARRRHIEALLTAQTHLQAAEQHVGLAHELLAEELRLAQRALGEITGQVTTEDLLGQIFSTFCIGK